MKTKPAALAVAVLLIAVGLSLAIFVPQQDGGHRFVKALYGDAPRTDGGETDIGGLVEKLKATGSDTYNYIMRAPDEGMEELGLILPALDDEGMYVWVTILPPSELSPEKRQDMAYVDYIGWARRLASLSLEHPNLEAWSIDNVMSDYDFFNPGYLEEITGAAGKINPGLAFIPVVYHYNVMSSVFAARARHFDGMQFYYTELAEATPDESVRFLPRMRDVRAAFDKPVIVGIYASPYAEGRETSAGYVDQVVGLAVENADGVMIYTLYHSEEKAEVIKKHFGG